MSVIGLPYALPGGKEARALNYHDLEKAREAARKIPGGSGGGQAARNTGLVIRIAIANPRGNCVMSGLLNEAGPIEKPELAGALLASWANCAYIIGQMAAGVNMSSLHIKVQPNPNPKAERIGAAIPDTATERFLVHVTRVEGLRQRGFSNDEIYKIVGPRRTLARRREQNETLTIAESDRVMRLERISAMADRVFGNHEKAQRWLRKHSRVLDEAPINLLQSETGAVLVEEELHRIDHGIFA